MQMENMTKLSLNCNIQAPMEVLNLIDDGKNPDEFTRDVLNGFIARIRITKGKLMPSRVCGRIFRKNSSKHFLMKLKHISCEFCQLTETSTFPSTMKVLVAFFVILLQ